MTLCKSEERVLRLNKRLECTYIALHSKERLKRLMFQLPFPLGLWLLLLLECQAASPSNRPAQENVQNDVEEGGERERERVPSGMPYGDPPRVSKVYFGPLSVGRIVHRVVTGGYQWGVSKPKFWESGSSGFFKVGTILLWSSFGEWFSSGHRASLYDVTCLKTKFNHLTKAY